MQTENHYLRLALSEGKFVSISDVANGLACECICPKCKNALVAKNNGKLRTAHFAHANDMDCKGAVESALHLLAKEILSKARSIFIPSYKYFYKEFEREEILIKYDKCISFDSVKIEEKVLIDREYIIADALCEIGGREIIIEFAKTHFIDEDKKSKLIKIGRLCIEFSISNGEQTEQGLIAQLNSNFFGSVWIVNKKGEALIEERRNKILGEISLAEDKKRKEEERERELYTLSQRKIDQQRQDEAQRQKNLKESELKKASEKGNLVTKCPVEKEFYKEYACKAFDGHEIAGVILKVKQISPVYDRSSQYVDIFLDGERLIIIPENYDK